MRYKKGKKLEISWRILNVLSRRVLSILGWRILDVFGRRILGIWDKGILRIIGRTIFNRRDQGNDGSLKCRLSEDHSFVFWILLGVSRVVELFTDGVTTRGHQHWIIHGDLGQIKAWVDGPNLLQEIIKPFTILYDACINKGLRSPELPYGVNLGHLCLLTKGRHLHL